jgi:hypothetical protein
LLRLRRQAVPENACTAVLQQQQQLLLHQQLLQLQLL